MKKSTCIYTTGLTLILGLTISTASAVTIDQAQAEGIRHTDAEGQI